MDRFGAPLRIGSLHLQGSEDVLRSLADPVRLKLLQLLLLEELNVSELVEIMGQPQSTTSRHLKVLRSAGLVHDRRDGTTVLYSAADGAADEDDLRAVLIDWLKRRPVTEVLRDRLQRVLLKRQDDAVGFFERLGNRWDALRWEAFGEAFATEAFLALLPREWTVADIGAGTGFLLPTLADNFCHVIAVEPAPTMLECARRRLAGRDGRNVTFHQGSLSQLPIRDEACDLAVACLVLHHVPEPDVALAEMHRIVRPGGRVLIVEQEAHEDPAFHDMMQDHWWGFEPGGLAQQTMAVGFGGVRHHRLATAKEQPGSVESPGLFVVTGERPSRS
ncbi:MAG: metalloregulator ArsR/SmtB family transcription factor [Phycisphaerae bacterium]|nr:metalloregulator ArsR/SmtB family transcription factor [Phycisphaerae bacterium]